jgi:hypothetical protein
MSSLLKEHISILARWLMAQGFGFGHTLCPLQPVGIPISAVCFETYWHRNYVDSGSKVSSLL